MCQQQQHLLVNHTDKTTSHYNFVLYIFLLICRKIVCVVRGKVKLTWKNCYFDFFPFTLALFPSHSLVDIKKNSY